MNPFEMVALIVIAVTIGGIIKARYGVRQDKDGNEYSVDAGASAAENARLRDEIRSLRDRIQVLERVVTDNESGARLDREIEKLRDKNSV